MNSLKTRSRKAAIYKTDPLISILRNCCFVSEQRKLSDADWLNNNKSGVMAAGRVLQFLGLAKPDIQSPIGWKAKPSFFQMAKDAEPALYAEPQYCDADEPELTKEDVVLIDMLDGIATNVLFDHKLQPSFADFGRHDFVSRRFVVLDFSFRLLNGVGLIRSSEEGEWKPSPLLCELFMQGALKVGSAARTSSLAKKIVGSVDNSDRSPKIRACRSK